MPESDPVDRPGRQRHAPRVAAHERQFPRPNVAGGSARPGRAIDGLPELLAGVSGLESEMQTVADAARRVLGCRSVAIYSLTDEGDEPGRLAPLAVSGAADRPGAPDTAMADLVAARWHGWDCGSGGWISREGVTFLPILYQRECVGILAVEHGDQGMPADARLRDLTNLLGLAALAIANHRLEVESSRRSAELRGLMEIGRIACAGSTAEGSLHGIFEAATSILSFDTASLFVVDERAGILRLSASHNIPPEVASRSRFRIGEGIVGWVIAQGRPAIVPDTFKDARFRLARGRRRKPHSLLVVPLRLHGRVIAAISFARHRPDAFTSHDLAVAEVIAVHAAHALEYARLAATEAEVESLRQGAELLSTISHDLRAPLSLIRVVVDLLRQQLPGMDEQQSALLDTMAHASEQLGKMINAVLETSRLEASLLRLQPERFELLGLAQDVVSTLSWRASPAHHLVVDVPPGLDVRADPMQIHRVLANLLDNAIKYSPEGGEVVIRARPGEDGVEVSVADHGIGIPPEWQSQVFERFCRAASGVAEGQSFGLGLYICRRIVEAHHGRISVESVPGRGSTFTFSLPAAGPAASPAAGNELDTN